VADDNDIHDGDAPRPAGGSGASEARRVRVVFVEDLAPLRRLVVSALAYEGIDVRGAGSLSEGLAAVVAGELDVLVTDQYLPDGTGRELVDHARRVRPGLKVMCVSGSPQLDAAFDRVIEKPFDVEILAAEIRALAGR
jgi:two-component system nitrogen regulation response regulator GlnG